MNKGEHEQVVSISERGQATIPKAFRDVLGVEAPGRVKFVRTDEGEIAVRPVRTLRDLRGSLADETDEAGRSPIEHLRAERERDRETSDALRERVEDGLDDEDRWSHEDHG